MLRVAGLRETIANLLQFFSFGFFLAFANEGRSRSIITVIRGRTFPQHPLGHVKEDGCSGLFRSLHQDPPWPCCPHGSRLDKARKSISFSNVDDQFSHHKNKSCFEPIPNELHVSLGWKSCKENWKKNLVSNVRDIFWLMGPISRKSCFRTLVLKVYGKPEIRPFRVDLNPMPEPSEKLIRRFLSRFHFYLAQFHIWVKRSFFFSVFGSLVEKCPFFWWVNSNKYGVLWFSVREFVTF